MHGEDFTVADHADPMPNRHDTGLRSPRGQLRVLSAGICRKWSGGGVGREGRKRNQIFKHKPVSKGHSVNYFTESTGWISYVIYGSTELGSPSAALPRSGQAPSWEGRLRDPARGTGLIYSTCLGWRRRCRVAGFSGIHGRRVGDATLDWHHHVPEYPRHALSRRNTRARS